MFQGGPLEQEQVNIHKYNLRVNISKIILLKIEQQVLTSDESRY